MVASMYGYEPPSYSGAASQYSFQELINFMEKYKGDFYRINYDAAVKTSKFDFFIKIREIIGLIVPNESLRFFGNTDIFLGETFILEVAGFSSSSLKDVISKNLTFTISGELELVMRLDAAIKENFDPSIRVPTLNWELMSEGRRCSKSVPISKAHPIYEEFCPWIGCDPFDYYNEYFNSQEPVLILLGESGTGKTSFIRSMIWHKILNVKITYDEELLMTDALFLDFMTDPNFDLLLIEDADLLLTSREHAGNKIMSKFLNISDGLIAINQRKKIIFTANILEPTRIDPALMRHGRCFDYLRFRPLSYDEACIAAHKAGLAIPTDRKNYTMADLFAKKRHRVTDRVEKVGFHRG